MIQNHILAIFFSCLICFPVHGYEPIEYLPDRVVVKYRPGEDIVTTAFVALKDDAGDPAGKPFIIQKSWLTEGEIAKLPVLLAYLESLGFHPFVETIQTSYNDKAQKLLARIGGYLLERAEHEPPGTTQDLSMTVCGANTTLFRHRATLDEGGTYTYEFYVDETIPLCHILFQTTNPNASYRLIGPDGRPANPASEKTTSLNRLLSLSTPAPGEWKLEVTGRGDHEVTVVGQSSKALYLAAPRPLENGLTEIEAKAAGYDSRVYVVCETRNLLEPAVFQKKILSHETSGVCKTRLKLTDGLYALNISLYHTEGPEKYLARTYHGAIVAGKLPPLFVSEAPKGKTTTTAPDLSAGLIGPLDTSWRVMAEVDGKPVDVTLSQKSSIRNIEQTDLKIGSPTLIEGNHRADIRITGLKGETIAQSAWEFTVDPPTSQTLLISEVFIYGENRTSWVELYAMREVDLADYRLTDLDGKPMVLSKTSLPVLAGQYALVHFTDGQTRMNEDGTAEIYLNTGKELSRTDDQLVLFRGDAIVDAVAWSDRDGAMDKDEAEDLNMLMAAGEWDTASTARRGKKDESLGRKSTVDTNKSSDFGVMPTPTPGKPNSNIVEGSHLGVPKAGAVLINEVAPNAPMAWAELHVVAGPVDLMEFALTDLDGEDRRIATNPATLNTGDYAVIYWSESPEAVSETDDVGDANGNGHREFYVADRRPYTSEDQLALIWEDTVVVDAVAWANGDGKFNASQIKDILNLVSLKSWNITFDGTEKDMAVLGGKNNSVGRIPNLRDSDKPSDWNLLIKPTPGRPNAVSTKPPRGSVLIVEVEPNNRSRDYAVLYCANGPVDISDMTLADMDGVDAPLAASPVTLQTGEMVTVRWLGFGENEVDGKGDINGNGIRELYLRSGVPASTDDQIALTFSSEIYDAVVYTNNDGKIDAEEMEDARTLIRAGEWSGNYDLQTDQRSSVNVGLYRRPIMRRKGTDGKYIDTNSKDDWEAKR